MKKSILFLFSIFIITTSCKNASDSKLIISEDSTVKSIVTNKENNITWSKELEGSRLSTPVNKKLNISNNVAINLDIYKINKENYVYPEYENFGKLDTHNLNNETKEKIDNFCKELSNGNFNSLSVYFSNNYIFNCVFFTEELKSKWNEYFEEPIKEEYSENEKLFNKWICGEPFIGDEITQIPIRLFCDYGYLDITLYLNSKKQNVIYQITINRWVKV